MAGPPPVVLAQAPPPGLQPDVQRWFKDREQPLIELNNALQPALTLPSDRAAAAPICARLAGAVTRYAALSRVPARSLEAPVAAGIQKLRQAAAACLAGGIPRAQQLIIDGLSERTAAQDALDGILANE